MSLRALGLASLGGLLPALLISAWLLMPDEPVEPREATVAAWGISNEPTLSIGTVDGPPETLLTNPIDATVLSDGTLVIAMYAKNTFTLRYFDSGGALLAEVGRYGDGPFEVSKGFTALIRLPGDSILIAEMSSRFHLFGPRGERVRSGRMSVPPYSFPIGHLGAGRIVFIALRPTAPIWVGVAEHRAETLVYDLATDTLTSLGQFSFGRDKLSASGRPLPLPFEGYAYSAVGPGRIWRAIAGATTFSAVGRRGPDSTGVTLAHPRRPVDEALRSRWEDEMLSSRGGSRRNEVEDHLREVRYPDTLPEVQRLDVDELGRVWVLRYEPSWSEAPYHWDIFTRDGGWIAELIVPFRVLGSHPRRAGFSWVRRVLEIGSDHIVIRNAGELGVARIEVFAINSNREDLE